MVWAIPSILFCYIPLPVLHLWSMMTMGADGWGSTMRASGERARKETARKAWLETQFFVVWMGCWGVPWQSFLENRAMLFSIAIRSLVAWKITIIHIKVSDG